MTLKGKHVLVTGDSGASAGASAEARGERRAGRRPLLRHEPAARTLERVRSTGADGSRPGRRLARR